MKIPEYYNIYRMQVPGLHDYRYNTKTINVHYKSKIIYLFILCCHFAKEFESTNIASLKCWRLRFAASVLFHICRAPSNQVMAHWALCFHFIAVKGLSKIINISYCWLFVLYTNLQYTCYVQTHNTASIGLIYMVYVKIEQLFTVFESWFIFSLPVSYYPSFLPYQYLCENLVNQILR